MSTEKTFRFGWLIPITILALQSFISAPSYGQYELDEENGALSSEPTLTVTIPVRRGYFNVQPVNVSLENIDKGDGLAKLRIDVMTNPAEHQHVLSAEIFDVFKVTKIGTRVRLAGGGKAVIEVKAETHSGKVLTVTGKVRHNEGVDFSDANILTRRLKPNIKNLAGPIGTTRVRLAKKGKNTRYFMATIYHPMLPQIGRQESNLLSSLQIHYRNTVLGKIDLSDSISTDPFISILFKDSESDLGPMTIQWKDQNGNIFQPKSIE